MYAVGLGVAQDDAEALKWYRKAAEQGIVAAQYDLGVMYGNGQGVAQDDAEAVRWVRKAAEQGNVAAQYDLGVMYGNGKGVAQNYVLANVWFILAAAQGNENARENRDISEQRMTPADVSEAQQLAREWRQKIPAKPEISLEIVQSQLKDRGYDPGPLDGFMDERTRSAIASFKADMASAGAISDDDRDLLESIEGLPK